MCFQSGRGGKIVSPGGGKRLNTSPTGLAFSATVAARPARERFERFRSHAPAIQRPPPRAPGRGVNAPPVGSVRPSPDRRGPERFRIIVLSAEARFGRLGPQRKSAAGVVTGIPRKRLSEPPANAS